MFLSSGIPSLLKPIAAGSLECGESDSRGSVPRKDGILCGEEAALSREGSLSRGSSLSRGGSVVALLEEVILLTEKCEGVVRGEEGVVRGE